MSADELKLFVHVEGAKSMVVAAKPGEVLRDVLIRAGALKASQDDILIFLGECTEALNEAEEVDNGADEHKPADAGLTLEALELHRHQHVHCHRCRHVAVEVNFNKKTKRHRFSPATTIEVVTAWARKKFKLDPTIAGEYVLQTCETKTQPRPGDHLSELVHAPDCSLCFDLVKEITPAG
ncbi:MAG TPA: hypothetical protein VNF04_08935 [Stellaceae bacterium]|nr:hypothetical protein [Stellaceae bacterium]